jgi:hypothetical protein
VLTIATLYSMVHISDLMAYAGHVLFLAVLAWGMANLGETPDAARRTGPGNTDSKRQPLTLGLGALSLWAAVLLVGRATGGAYDLSEVSLSAIATWPLVLVALFVVLWLGLSPFTGWSAQGPAGASTALVQALVLGIPALVLLLRLQALITSQALGGTVPAGWTAFTTGLMWAGGLTALVAAAGLPVWAGTGRWTALLTAHAMGLALWALALDNPTGRLAAVAILTAFSAGRVALELAGGAMSAHPLDRLSAGTALASLIAAPLTSGFVGIWLLASALSGTQRPLLAIGVVAVAILAAGGAILGYMTNEAPQVPQPRALTALGVAAAGILVLGGVLPAVWLPRLAAASGIAGGRPDLALPWVGVQSGGLLVPLLLMAVGALVVGAVGRLVVAWAGAGVVPSGILLPPALHRTGRLSLTAHRPTGTAQGTGDGLPGHPPALLWWLSLAWMEAGIWGAGALLGRLGIRAGHLLGRLEGRYYLPLALIAALLAILAAIR